MWRRCLGAASSAACYPLPYLLPLLIEPQNEPAQQHNEASQARPLHLRLVADAAATTLRVENTYQPRLAGLAPSLGMGLANVRQRYGLLGAEQPVEITH